MTVLDGYGQFGGRHWETGPVYDLLAFQGVRAPHTGGPISEALMLGLTGGVTVMYFVFEYEALPPHLFVGTRNTFDPLATLFDRLGLTVTESKTSSARRATAALEEALAAGRPALVWAAKEALPYHPGEPDHAYARPLLVYGYEAGGEAQVADGAAVPLTVPAAALDAARAAQPGVKRRLVTLTAPDDWSHLPAAVEAAIQQCVALMLRKPPRGPASNFGLKALDKWADLLVNETNKRGWMRLFPPGPLLLRALRDVYASVVLENEGAGGGRYLYADFLDEAAALLERPALRDAVRAYLECGRHWDRVAAALLPDSIPLLAETRTLLHERHDLFRTAGGASLNARREIAARLDAMISEAARSFPLDHAQSLALLTTVRDRVLDLRAREADAVRTLEAAMA